MTIKTEIKNQIATVTLNRPEVHNAFNDEMMKALIKTFRDFGKDENIRAIVFQAEGKSFCAGADLNWMKSTANFTYDENVKDPVIETAPDVISKITQTKCLFKFPVLLEVNKKAIYKIIGDCITFQGST